MGWPSVCLSCVGGCSCSRLKPDSIGNTRCNGSSSCTKSRSGTSPFPLPVAATSHTNQDTQCYHRTWYEHPNSNDCSSCTRTGNREKKTFIYRVRHTDFNTSSMYLVAVYKPHQPLFVESLIRHHMQSHPPTMDVNFQTTRIWP